MTDLLILGAYVIAGLFVYRKGYIAFLEFNAREFPSLDEDGADRGFAAAFALIGAVLWPLALAGFLVYRFATPTSPRQLQKRRNDLKDEIRRLEREAGLR